MRFLTRLTLFLVAIPLIAQPQLFAQESDTRLTPELEEELGKLFFEWDRLDRPGGSAAIIQDGEVVFQRSYGLASLELQVPNKDITLYDVAALAEPFTATAVASLIADGRLSLDEPISNQIPELAALDRQPQIKHLIYHTSGLWDWRRAWQLSGGYLEDVITFEQILGLLSQQTAPSFEPGSRFEHCVSNYTLLAEIVARVTGEPFPDWLWANVLRPAGMTRSMVQVRPGESIDGCATSYTYNTRSGYRRGSTDMAAPGAHGLYSNIRNMATWLAGLEKGPLLIEGTLNDGSPVPYIHGLHVGELNGRTCWNANGQWQGWNSAMRYYPEERLGVVILCNWISGWVNPVRQCNQIANLFLTEEGDDEAEQPADTPDPDFTADPSGYGQLIGDYRWEPGEVFVITVQEDRLAYQEPRFILPLIELSKDYFVIEGYPYYFTFRRDEDGRAASVLIEHEGDADVNAPRIELAHPGPADLAELAGEYFSPKLDALYTVVAADSTLTLSHSRLGETRLEPEAIDHFMCNSPAFQLLEFKRDNQGSVTGFSVDTMNLIFRRRP